MLYAMPVSIGLRYDQIKLQYRLMPIGHPTWHSCTNPGVTEWGDRSDSCNFTALPARRYNARPLAAKSTGRNRSDIIAGALREHSSSDAKRRMRAFPVFEIATRACPLLLIQPIDSWRSSQPFKVSRYNGSEVSLA